LSLGSDIICIIGLVHTNTPRQLQLKQFNRSLYIG